MRLGVLALLVLVASSPCAAQAVRLEGRGDSEAERVLQGILERGRYQLISRDTVLPDSFRAPGDLLVARAAVRLSGQVDGDVGVLGGELFIRPGARVGGSIAVLGGEAYPSRLASAGPVHRPPAGAQVRTLADSAGYTVRVIPPPEPSRFALPGVFGSALPTYDRVNGAQISAGAGYNFTGDTLTGPSTRAWVSYATARERVGGGVHVGLPVDSSTRLFARAERGTFTSDRWIRGDLLNSLAAAVFGVDERNYYESDRVSVGIGRAFPAGAEPVQLAPRLSVIASRDRSLSRHADWSFFGDGLERANPEIDDGTIYAIQMGSALRFRGRFASFHGDAAVEQGFGDATFTHASFGGRFDTPVVWRNHRAAVRFYVLQPLAGNVPRQRWSFVGGPGTLPFLETGELWGDHLRIIESSYAIPLPQLHAPVLGAPSLMLLHAAGVAWASGEPEPDWASDAGVGLRFRPGYVSIRFDVAGNNRKPRVGVRVAFPFGG